MTLIKAFGVLFYLTLLTGALIVVFHNIEDFLEDKTYYSVAYEPVTLRDLPTLTICWPLNNFTKVMHYGKDFTIDMKVLGHLNKTVTLVENKSVNIFDIAIHFSKIWPKSLPKSNCFDAWRNLQCTEG